MSERNILIVAVVVIFLGAMVACMAVVGSHDSQSAMLVVQIIGLATTLTGILVAILKSQEATQASRDNKQAITNVCDKIDTAAAAQADSVNAAVAKGVLAEAAATAARKPKDKHG